MAKKASTSPSALRGRAGREGEALGAAPAAAPAEPFPTLGSVLGQERAIGTLWSAVRSGRVHHAWIFHGPPGVGKFTAAVALAGVLLDPASKSGVEPDGTSPAGALLRRWAHPDLHVVRKELARVSREPAVRDRKLISIPREVVDEFLIEPAQRTRVVQGDTLAHKVFIVDEAELLNHTSQTVLLKTIEEPPAGTVIILVSSSEHELAATIRSRCQRVGFAPLPEGAMRAWLERSGLSVPEGQREWLLEFSGNAPGALKAALDAGLAAWHERLSPMLASASQGRYAVELGPTMAGLVDEYATAWVEAHQNASKDAATRAGAAWMFRLVGAWLRTALSSAREPRGVLAAIDALGQAEQHLDRNLQSAFVFEWLSAELSAAMGRGVVGRV